MKQPITILHIVAGMNMGGAETLLMNILRRIDRANFRFVFLCYGYEPFDYENEIVDLGGKIVRIPSLSTLGPVGYVRAIRSVIRQESPDIVHCHTYYNSMFGLIAARQEKVAVRITHSHNTLSENNPPRHKKAYFKLAHRVIRQLSTHRIACGRDAGLALFGSQPFETLDNGIILDKFYFDTDVRGQLRAELGIDDDVIVLGHVGRFEEQKNHDFLIDIFHAYKDRQPASQLILVGDGPLRSAITEKVKRLGLSNSVHFLGKRSDVNHLYSVMDAFVMPSLHEGLPVTLVETQANGLMAVISDEIDSSVQLTPQIIFCPLVLPADEWAIAIEKADLSHHNTSDTMQKSPYNIDQTVEKLTGLYRISVGENDG